MKVGKDGNTIGRVDKAAVGRDDWRLQVVVEWRGMVEDDESKGYVEEEIKEARRKLKYCRANPSI